MTSSLPDWPARLDAFLADRSRQPFEWGVNDCALFAADAVLAMTGVDFAVSFRGYRSGRGAGKLLRECRHLSGIASALLGEPMEPGFAQRGDVVLVAGPARNSLGICLGAHYAGPGKFGVEYGPIDRALSAWRA
jgi:hypothetical protein